MIATILFADHIFCNVHVPLNYKHDTWVYVLGYLSTCGLKEVDDFIHQIIWHELLTQPFSLKARLFSYGLLIDSPASLNAVLLILSSLSLSVFWEFGGKRVGAPIIDQVSRCNRKTLVTVLLAVSERATEKQITFWSFTIIVSLVYSLEMCTVITALFEAVLNYKYPWGVSVARLRGHSCSSSDDILH